MLNNYRAETKCMGKLNLNDNKIRMMEWVFKCNSSEEALYKDELEVAGNAFRGARKRFENNIGEEVFVIENRDYFSVKSMVVRQVWIPTSLAEFAPNPPTNVPYLGQDLMDRSLTGEEVTEDGALLATGFEDALLGFGTRFIYDVAIYDYSKCIEILARDMSQEDAEEYFEFNVRGAFVGENTPVFINVGDLEYVSEGTDG